MKLAKTTAAAASGAGPERPAGHDCHYRRLHDSMHDPFVLMDLDGRLLEWNKPYLTMLGYAAAELQGLTHDDLTPEKWRGAGAQIASQQVIADGQSRLYEQEYIRKDGTVLPVELRAHLLRDTEGKPAAIWAIVRDISERKRVEDALREQEEFFRLVAEHSGDFIAVLDREGRRLYNSPSYKHFYGDTQYMVGTDSFSEVHPEDRDLVRKVFLETVKTGIGQCIEFRFVLPDGGVRQMESRGGVIKDADGRVMRVVVVSNDITERKQAEEQIHNLAFFDPLTHLPNRRMLSDRIRQAMASTRRSGRYGALMFLDLDNFKPINDAHGHGVGDLLLIEAAQRIAGCLRAVDTVARFGGDEFVILLNDLDQAKAESAALAGVVAQKVRARLAEPYALPVRHDGVTELVVEHQCTSSIGLVLFIDNEYAEEDLLRCADIAMYRAKDEGRDRVCLVDPKDFVTP